MSAYGAGAFIFFALEYLQAENPPEEGFAENGLQENVLTVDSPDRSE